MWWRSFSFSGIPPASRLHPSSRRRGMRRCQARLPEPLLIPCPFAVSVYVSVYTCTVGSVNITAEITATRQRSSSQGKGGGFSFTFRRRSLGRLRTPSPASSFSIAVCVAPCPSWPAQRASVQHCHKPSVAVPTAVTVSDSESNQLL